MFHSLYKRTLSDPYFRHSAVFFSASMLVAVLNYLFHPLLARHLSFHDFGDVQAFLALFGMLSTLMGGFSTATIHASVNAENPQESSAVIAALQRTALMIIVPLIAILILGSRFFADQLHFSSAWLFVVLGGSLILSALQTFRTGYLQGQKDFKRVSLANILISGGRLVFAFLFVWLGWHAFGAVFGILSAQLLSFAFVFAYTRNALAAHDAPLDRARVKKEISTVIFFAISTMFVTVLYNTDILVVKRLFPPDLAGAYSGISTVANIVFFSTSSFAAVLLSSIKRSHTPEERRKTFLKAFLLITLIGGAASLVCALFPTFVIHLLMGSRYIPYAYLLPWLVGAFFCASLVNVCVYFNLALANTRLLRVAICVSVLLVLLILFRHDSPEHIAQDYLLINILAVLGTGGTVWRLLRS